MAAPDSQFAHPRGSLGRLAGIVMAFENRKRNAFALAILAPEPGDALLEIGFGPGVTIAQLAKRQAQGMIAGVDSSSVMVAQAKRRNAAAIAAGSVDLRHGSAELLPYPDGAFDRALAVNSHVHWPNPIAGLRELRRVLKPGGIAVIAEQPVWEKGDADDYAFANTVAARLAAAGFAQIEVVSRRMRPAPTICVRGVNPVPPLGLPEPQRRESADAR